MGDKTDAEIRQDMWKAMAASPFVMLGTQTDDQHFEPMYAVLDEDADGEFWFYTKVDNRAAGGGDATVQFVSKGHDLYASLRGTLTPELDPAVIDRYWNKQVEAWYDGGREDPSLLMLRFNLRDAEIWETDHSLTGRLKMLTGHRIYDQEAGSHAVTSLD